MERTQSPYPLWLLHVRILGGAKRFMTISTLFTCGLFVGFAIFRRVMGDKPFASVVDTALMILGALQMLLLFLGGNNAIYRAALRDFESKMIESHRLTPLSNLTICLGYVFGPTSQVLLLDLITLFFGATLIVISSGGLGAWLLAGVLMLSAAIMTWTFATLLGVRNVKPINLGQVLLFAAMASFILTLAPGLILLTGTASCVHAFKLMGSSRPFYDPMAWLLVSINGALAISWLLVAATKYRRPDRPAVSGGRGLALLLFWVLLFAIPIVYLPRGIQIPGPPPAQLGIIWIASITALMVLASTIIHGTATFPRDAADGRTSLARRPALITVAATLIICGGMAALARSAWPGLVEGAGTGNILKAWGLTVLAVFCCLQLASSSFVVVNRVTGKSRLAISCFFLIVVIGGPVFMFMMRESSELFAGFYRSWVLGFSPVGTMTIVWSDAGGPILPGWIFYVLLTCGMTWMAHRYDRARAGTSIAAG